MRFLADAGISPSTLDFLSRGDHQAAVQENRNLMKNDLSTLPWAPGQLHRVGNYWEAVGVIAAIRAGIDPSSVRRPLAETCVSNFAASRSELEAEALRVANR